MNTILFKQTGKKPNASLRLRKPLCQFIFLHVIVLSLSQRPTKATHFHQLQPQLPTQHSQENARQPVTTVS